jgi:outer membrane protein assembly factor BamA
LHAEVGGYFEQRDELFRDATFSQRIWGVYGSAKRRLSPFTQVTLGLDNQWSIPRSQPDGLPAALLTGFPENQLFVQRLSLLLQYDRRDDVFNPHRGEYYEMTGELAGRLLGRARQFNKGTTTGDWYLPLQGRSVLALRVQVGTIVARAPAGEAPLEGVPLQDLFRTGGAYTVRGYPEEGIVGADSTGGLLLLISNAEYRFPVAGPVFAAVFVDGGNVWSRRQDFKLRQLGLGHGPAGGNDYRWSTGLSLRLQTPLGPFRGDAAYRLRSQLRDPKRAGWGFDVSIGQPF